MTTTGRVLPFAKPDPAPAEPPTPAPTRARALHLQLRVNADDVARELADILAEHARRERLSSEGL